MSASDAQYANPQHLVSTEWLAAHLGDPDLRIVDCTVDLTTTPEKYTIVSGRAAYDQAHIPGALFADVVDAFSNPSSGLFFTLPSAERFTAAMRALGIENRHRIILYSGTTFTWATRMFWMLRAFGHDNTAILDGGLKQWRADGRPLTSEATAVVPSSWTAQVRPGVFVGTSDVEGAIASGSATIVCALGRPQYTGERPSYLANHGRIPGAKHLASANLVDGDGKLLPPAALREKVGAAALPASGRLMIYCGAGIAATGDAFALTLLGRDDISVYDGSMQEWFTRGRPVERDPA